MLLIINHIAFFKKDHKVEEKKLLPSQEFLLSELPLEIHQPICKIK